MITESELYGLVFVEVADNTANVTSWVDITEWLTSGGAERGGIKSIPGQSSTDVGSMSVTFKDLASTVNVGYWIRFRVGSGVVWSGYVSDITRRIEFSKLFSNGSATFTTVSAADWVGVASGTVVDGSIQASALYSTGTTFIGKLNDAISASYDLISSSAAAGALSFGNTDYVGSVSEHLDLLSNSGYNPAVPGTAPFRWNATPTSPTTSTPPPGGIYANAGSFTSTGLTFTDVPGGSSLHYTDLELGQSSQDVTNFVEVKNHSMTVYSGNPVLRTYEDYTYTAQRSSSIAINGQRSATVDTRAPMVYATHGTASLPDINLVWNPNVQVSSDYWVVDNSALSGCRRASTALEATPFAAFEGDYAMRRTVLTATSNVTIMYAHDNEEGIPVVPGYQYRFIGRGLRYSSLTDLQIRADVIFYDDNSAVISTISSGQVALTSIRTWYAAAVSGTAPSTAVTAKIRLVYTRSGGANLTVGAKVFADGYQFFRVANLTETMTYLSGDTLDTYDYVYAWLGDEYRSESARFMNPVSLIASEILYANEASEMEISSLRWNAQEALASTSSLEINKTIQIVFDGVTATYLILGISFEISRERLMVNINVKKVS